MRRKIRRVYLGCDSVTKKKDIGKHQCLIDCHRAQGAGRGDPSAGDVVVRKPLDGLFPGRYVVECMVIAFLLAITAMIPSVQHQ